MPPRPTPSSPEPEKRRRLRATRVCGRCRRLKLRCDLATPCASCTRAGLPDGCAYAALGGLDARAVHAKNGVPMPAPAPAPGPAPPSPAATEYGAGSDLGALVALFPGAEVLRGLRDAFARFDALGRLVPPLVAYELDPLQALRGEGEERAPQREDAPALALLASMCLVGALAEQRPAAQLRRLSDALLRYCTAQGPHTVEYAHAAVVACAAETTGEHASPARAWVALGTARAALLLARVYEDQEESLWERERRRRVWYHLYTAQAFAAARLGLPFEPGPPVPRPLVLPDAALRAAATPGEAAFLAGDSPAEWAFPASEIAWADLTLAQAALMRSPAPLAERLAEAHSAIDAFSAALPPPIREGSTPEALATRIAMHDALVALYRPYFEVRDADARMGLLAAGIDPLARGLVAAHALAGAVADLGALPDGGPALWAFGARAFTAGMAIAYAELAGRGSVHDVDALDGALGSLRACAARGGAANGAALAVLEGVRRLVRARRQQRVQRIARARDPPAYAPQHAWADDEGGGRVESPPTPPALGWSGQEGAGVPGASLWEEWEGLFRGFLEGGGGS